MTEPRAGSSKAPLAEAQDAPPPEAGRQKTAEAAAVDDVVEEVPDPDEDDLDDLDEMLDEFSALKTDESKKPPETAASRPGRLEQQTARTADEDPPKVEDLLTDEEFAKELQAGMADLLGEMEGSSEMQAHFETIFKELGAAAGSGVPAGSSATANANANATATTTAAPSGGSRPGTSGGAAAAAAAAAADASFQETIRRTMERMQASGEQATAAATAGDAAGSDNFLEELLKEMQQAGAGAGGEGGEEEFSKMLMGMMEQLTNKEILYEPMKELGDKFPEWMDKNRETTAKEDLARYEEQMGLVKEIVAKFEEPTYADSNTAHREYIVDRMQKMQAAGSPPSDLVGDMPSAQEALNMPMDESCTPQ